MIRRSAEEHEGAGRWSMLGPCLIALALSPILILAVLGNALLDHVQSRAYRKTHGYCLKCGHKHEGPLELSSEAHGWEGTKTCAG